MPKLISVADRHWYVSRLLAIPGVLGTADGKWQCREIGQEVHQRFGHRGMVIVCEFIRDEFDQTTASEIEAAWDRIGEWLR
jgi:hypothetical protein